MFMQPISVILTDIEGTTTSISFVVDVLFPYFRGHIHELASLKQLPEVNQAFNQTVQLALELDGEQLKSDAEIIAKLHQWSVEDRKITPLKTVQGLLWEKGYKEGILKGHVYDDVAENLNRWKSESKELAVFSSGSVAAQQLIFRYSTAGDLTNYFSNYFDTNTGGKRDSETYLKIAQIMRVLPENLLFLSDIPEELVAAEQAGCQTIQLVRPGTQAAWPRTATDFNTISFQ